MVFKSAIVPSPCPSTLSHKNLVPLPKVPPSNETATGQRTVAVSFVNYKYFLILNLSVMFFINESMYSLGHLYFLKSESALFYFLYKTSTLIFVIDSTSLKAILNLDFVNSRTSIHLILDFCVNLDSE